MDAGSTSDRETLSSVTDGPPSHAVVRAVADADGVDPTDLPPLYAAVDPDALDAMFRGRTAGSVTFEYTGYTVTVDASADVTVR